jgi:hypothetical protein
LDDKLIDLGTNRYTINPQFGIVHNRGKCWNPPSALSYGGISYQLRFAKPSYHRFAGIL